MSTAKLDIAIRRAGLEDMVNKLISGLKEDDESTASLRKLSASPYGSTYLGPLLDYGADPELAKKDGMESITDLFGKTDSDGLLRFLADGADSTIQQIKEIAALAKELGLLDDTPSSTAAIPGAEGQSAGASELAAALDASKEDLTRLQLNKQEENLQQMKQATEAQKQLNDTAIQSVKSSVEQLNDNLQSLLKQEESLSKTIRELGGDVEENKVDELPVDAGAMGAAQETVPDLMTTPPMEPPAVPPDATPPAPAEPPMEPPAVPPDATPPAPAEPPMEPPMEPPAEPPAEPPMESPTPPAPQGNMSGQGDMAFSPNIFSAIQSPYGA